MAVYKNVTDDILYVGVNDHKVDLFEGQYVVPNGMCYNSYVIVDEKIAVMDTVDQNFTHEWLDNIEAALKGRKPDYLVVQHMEPDHAANIENFVKTYPDVQVVANEKTFTMMGNFFRSMDLTDKKVVVDNGGTLTLGKHTLTFVFAPMVHWPEVMVTYDSTDKVLFSADGFGKFGAMDAEEPWDDEARRYYIGIVGKYGKQVQDILKVAGTLDIAKICPLHGPILTEDLGHYIQKYDTWSSYAVEEDGIVIAYTSVYGHTREAVQLLENKLKEKGCPKVVVYDLARDDMAAAVADAFRYGKLVLATTTYNSEIYPFMKFYIDHLTERAFQNRTIGLIENGSWAPTAAKVMKDMFADSQDITWTKNNVKIMSSISSENKQQIEAMADELCREYVAKSDAANKNDMTALFRIGYGLYVVTSNDGNKDNGLIVNTVTQLTDNPNRVAVNINKANYSHHIIKQTGVLNVNCLSVEAPFKVFQNFGFQSGRSVDKFAGCENICRSDNGLIFLPKYINAFMSLKVEQYVDLGTHGMFICTVTEARIMSDKDTMTYTYYQQNVKPKPQTEGKKGYVCKVCGYIHEGELPDDFICPLCKHGAIDFEPIK